LPRKPVVGCDGFEIAGVSQKNPCASKDSHSCFGWRHGPAGSNIEECANVAFECTDSLCDRRWCEIEAARRFGHRTVVDDRDEAIEKASIHSKEKLSSKEIVVYIFFFYWWVHSA